MAARIQSGAIQCQRNGSILTPIGAPAPSGEPVRLVYEDFEDDEFAPGINLTKAAIVTSNPYSGTRCVRVNAMAGATDPLIAGAVYNAGNALAIQGPATPEYQGLALQEADPTVRTIRYKFRFDDCVWKGYTAENRTTRWDTKADAGTLEMKGGYFGRVGYQVDGFFTGYGGRNGSVRLADNALNNQRGDDGWQNSEWATPGRSGYVSFHLTALDGSDQAVDFGPGTGWHEFKMIIDASHPDYNQVRMYIDNNLCRRIAGYCLDGIMRVPKTWNVEHWSCSYTGTHNTELSENGAEYACGIQFDEFEAWAGEV